MIGLRPWFAWRPVKLTMGGRRVWLCWVYRRYDYGWWYYTKDQVQSDSEGVL